MSSIDLPAPHVLKTAASLSGVAHSDLRLSKPVLRPPIPLRTLIGKRVMDLAISAIALLVLLPLLVIVVIAIKLDSRGPIFFRQKRWGKDCKIIEVYKFRSMHTDACDPSGITQTTVNDRRVTRIGKVLRRTNVDELPQLLNVLKGDMSLVGPRCHAIGMLAAGVPYETLVPTYHLRHAIKPGLTGLAQMRGLRGPTVRPAKARARIACDLFYIGHLSLGFDLRIMAGTVINELRGGKGF
jgi:polysaccharide biosynthesis protein PslA